jgi:hypothetical protein
MYFLQQSCRLGVQQTSIRVEESTLHFCLWSRVYIYGITAVTYLQPRLQLHSIIHACCVISTSNPRSTSSERKLNVVRPVTLANSRGLPSSSSPNQFPYLKPVTCIPQIQVQVIVLSYSLSHKGAVYMEKRVCKMYLLTQSSLCDMYTIDWVFTIAPHMQRLFQHRLPHIDSQLHLYPI